MQIFFCNTLNVRNTQTCKFTTFTHLDELRATGRFSGPTQVFSLPNGQVLLPPLLLEFPPLEEGVEEEDQEKIKSQMELEVSAHLLPGAEEVVVEEGAVVQMRGLVVSRWRSAVGEEWGSKTSPQVCLVYLVEEGEVGGGPYCLYYQEWESLVCGWWEGML